MPNKTKEDALLNKVFRAVTDRVCPKCSGTLTAMDNGGVVYEYCCFYTVGCGFSITEEERAALGRKTIPDWGEEPVKAFENWRANRSV